MNALTLWQPWASLIMVAAKPLRILAEERPTLRPRAGDRRTHRSPAGMRPVKPKEVEDLLDRLGTDYDKTGLVAPIASQVLERCRAAAKYQTLPLGCRLGAAVLGKPKRQHPL